MRNIAIIFIAVLTLTAGAAAQCQGTQSLLGDDYQLQINIDGTFQPGATHTLEAGEDLGIVTGTGNLAFSGAFQYILAEVSGMPSAPLQGLCVSATADTQVILGGALFTGGNPMSIGVYPGGFDGVSFKMQALIGTPNAANGVYATTDVKEITFSDQP